MIYYTNNKFDSVKLNPFDNNNPYAVNWILLKLIDDNSFSQYTGGGIDGVFQLVLTKKNIDWQYRVLDFIQYENEAGKNIIVAINENDLNNAKIVYANHSYRDAFLRDYEMPVLMHSTTKDNYHCICKSGYLKSWNLLKEEGLINENTPIGSLLGDPKDYSDYIMFNNGGYSAEIVVSSKQKGFINMNLDDEYVAGARMYFDAAKIAADGYLARDGAHLKVKDILSLKYLIWTATPNELGVSEITTPRIFAALSDSTFKEKFGIKL